MLGFNSRMLVMILLGKCISVFSQNQRSSLTNVPETHNIETTDEVR